MGTGKTTTELNTSSRRRLWVTFLAGISLLVLASSVSAQSLGELARKEREKKKEQPPRATRVYTDEDLKKERILDTADRDRFQVSREKRATPNGVNAASAAPGERPGLPSGVSKSFSSLAPAPPELAPPPVGAPLGDIARYYRAQKLLREEAERAAVPSSTSFASIPAAARPRVNAASRVAPPLLERPIRAARTPVALANKPRWIEIRIARGDTLWSLARRHLGKGTRWQELAGANPELTDPNRVRVGDSIRVPVNVVQDGPQFRVRAGDTLWHLAAAKYGRGASWPCIAQANPQLGNPDLLLPGQPLFLPATCVALP